MNLNLLPKCTAQHNLGSIQVFAGYFHDRYLGTVILDQQSCTCRHSNFFQFCFSVRKKVLRHHPDKKKSTTDSSDKKLSDEDFFACITIANDILSNKEKRQAYDSVDPLFDDSIPPVNANSKSNFIDVFGPVFERNARLV